MTEYNNVVQKINLSNHAITSYQEDGYLVIPNFIEKSKITPLGEEIFHALEVQLGVQREELFEATNTSDKLRQCQGYLKDSLMDDLINSDNTLSVAVKRNNLFIIHIFYTDSVARIKLITSSTLSVDAISNIT